MPTDALVNFSAVLQSQGLNVSLWFPLALCNATNAKATFASMPKVTHLLHECVETDAAWDAARTCAEVVRSVHPHAGIWTAACARNTSQLKAFFKQVAKPRNVAFLTGVASHASPIPFQQYTAMAHAAAPGLPVRQYPDICHTTHAQYPVTDWHPAWALTHARNPVVPMPMLSASIVRLNSNGSSPNMGVGGYSEGVSDDLNKHVWSALAEDGRATVVEAVQQYARYHFGSEHEAAMTKALFGLEQNWVGDAGSAASVSLVADTLAALQTVERAMSPSGLRSNWRLLAYLYRGYFDSAVQARLIFEASQDTAAYKALRDAPSTGSAAAILAAKEAYSSCQNNTDPDAVAWTARVAELAGLINATVGNGVLQSQQQDLNLGTFRAAPLGDKAWLLSELSTIEAGGGGDDERSRLSTIASLVEWEDPGGGGYYDALGVGVLQGRAPRLERGEGWIADPALYYTTLNAAFYYDASKKEAAPPPVRAAWRSFTQSVGEDYPVALKYQGLDPYADYVLTVLFFATNLTHSGGGNTELNLLKAGRTVLQGPALSPFPMRPVSFAVPRNETQSGALRVECKEAPLAPTAMPMSSRCSIISVWLSVKNKTSG